MIFRFLRQTKTANLIIIAAALIGLFLVTVVVSKATATGQKPPVKKNLAEALQNARNMPQGVTARVDLQSRMIESLGQVKQSGRLWANNRGDIRIEMQGEQNDSQMIIRKNKMAIVYNGQTYVIAGERGKKRQKKSGKINNKEKRGLALTNEQLQQEVAAAGLIVKDPRPVVIAQRPAYALSLSPQTEKGLIKSGEIIFDAEYGLPLALSITGRGDTLPALSLQATSANFGPVADSVFQIGSKPASKPARQKQEGSSGRVAKFPRAIGERKASKQKGQTVVYGNDLDAIVVQSSPRPISLPETTTIGDKPARLLKTPIGTVVSFEAGGVSYTAAGSVSKEDALAFAQLFTQSAAK